MNIALAAIKNECVVMVITGWVVDIDTNVPRLATLRVAKKVKNVQCA